MSVQEDQENRIKYLQLIYETAKEAHSVSPGSITFGLSKYGKLRNGKVEMDEQESGGYVLGEQLGLSKQQIDAIVKHSIDRDYLSSSLGMRTFRLTSDGIDYIEELEEDSSFDFSPNIIQVGDVTGNLQIQQASDHSKQEQQTHINETQFKELLELIKLDLMSDQISQDDREDVLDELTYAEKQFSKGRDINTPLKNIGSAIKSIGKGVFTNLIASPIFELIKPLMGL